jgi:hypothetical protein
MFLKWEKIKYTWNQLHVRMSLTNILPIRLSVVAGPRGSPVSNFAADMINLKYLVLM